MKTLRAPRPALNAMRLPTLTALLAGGVSLIGCATEADAPPTVTPLPVRTAGAEAVVTPTQPPVVVPQPPNVPVEPVPLGGAPMPVTWVPPTPPPSHAHTPVRLIAR